MRSLEIHIRTPCCDDVVQRAHVSGSGWLWRISCTRKVGNQTQTSTWTHVHALVLHTHARTHTFRCFSRDSTRLRTSSASARAESRSPLAMSRSHPIRPTSACVVAAAAETCVGDQWIKERTKRVLACAHSPGYEPEISCGQPDKNTKTILLDAVPRRATARSAAQAPQLGASQLPARLQPWRLPSARWFRGPRAAAYSRPTRLGGMLLQSPAPIDDCRLWDSTELLLPTQHRDLLVKVGVLHPSQSRRCSFLGETGPAADRNPVARPGFRQSHQIRFDPFAVPESWHSQCREPR